MVSSPHADDIKQTITILIIREIRDAIGRKQREFREFPPGKSPLRYERWPVV